MVVLLAAVNLCLVLLSALSGAMSEASAQSRPMRIIAFGDSLTAGYGLPPKNAFPVRLAAALKARGPNYAIIKGGLGA
jgi:acyl-CoA thioesterase-1